MIKAVLFDYGGVLTRGGWRGSFKRTIADYFGIAADSLNIGTDDVELDMLGQYAKGLISTKDFFDELNKRHKTSSAITPARFLEHPVQKEIHKKSEDVFELAEALRAKGIKTGIASNVQKITADKLHELGHYEHFEPLILSCEIGISKPEIEFYKIAIEQTSSRPNEIVFVDDKEECLEPAKQLGMKVVEAASPEQIVRDVKKIILQENGLKL